jgi:cell division protein FtsB
MALFKTPFKAPLNLSGGRVPKSAMVAAAVVCGAGLFLIMLGKFRQEVSALRQQLRQRQQQLSELEAENQQLAQQLNSLQTERRTMEERMTSLRSELAAASAELERSRVGVEDLKGRQDRIESERADFERRMSSAAQERDQARQRVEQLEQEREQLGRSATRMREQLTLLDRDYRALMDKLAGTEASPHPGVNVIADIRPGGRIDASAGDEAAGSGITGTVELPPIIVQRDEEAGQDVHPVQIRARVRDVNGEHGFVVIDRGGEHGVHLGMVFDIVREGNVVGQAKITRVRPQLAAGDIVRSRTADALRVGDLAVQTGP